MANEEGPERIDGGKLLGYLGFVASALSVVALTYFLGWLHLKGFCSTVKADWFLNKLTTMDFLIAGAPLAYVIFLPLAIVSMFVLSLYIELRGFRLRQEAKNEVEEQSRETQRLVEALDSAQSFSDPELTQSLKEFGFDNIETQEGEPRDDGLKQLLTRSERFGKSKRKLLRSSKDLSRLRTWMHVFGESKTRISWRLAFAVAAYSLIPMYAFQIAMNYFSMTNIQFLTTLWLGSTVLVPSALLVYVLGASTGFLRFAIEAQSISKLTMLFGTYLYVVCIAASVNGKTKAAMTALAPTHQVKLVGDENVYSLLLSSSDWFLVNVAEGDWRLRAVSNDDVEWVRAISQEEWQETMTQRQVQGSVELIEYDPDDVTDAAILSRRKEPQHKAFKSIEYDPQDMSAAARESRRKKQEQQQPEAAEPIENAPYEKPIEYAPYDMSDEAIKSRQMGKQKQE